MQLNSLSINLNIWLVAQKNRLIETVLLSTNNIRFGREIRRIIFQYALLSGGLGLSCPLEFILSIYALLNKNSVDSLLLT